jgi:hypothetical protein
MAKMSQTAYIITRTVIGAIAPHASNIETIVNSPLSDIETAAARDSSKAIGWCGGPDVHAIEHEQFAGINLASKGVDLTLVRPTPILTGAD